MVRNAGKYKPKRGGGRHFTSARVLSGKDEADKSGMGMWDDGEQGSSGEESGSGSEEESEEESFVSMRCLVMAGIS